MLTVDHLIQRAAETGVLGLLQEVAAGKFGPYRDDRDRFIDAFSDLSWSHPDIGAKLLKHPLPDCERLGTYTGDTQRYHLIHAFRMARDISHLAEAHGFPVQSAGNVLDYGCGTSRILRYFVQFMPGPNYFGSEVAPKVIEWGREAFPEITYLQHGPQPPLSIPDGQFDLIYAFSIFSHLDEPTQHRWLRELRRVSKRGALLVLSVQSDTLMARIQREPVLAAELLIPDPPGIRTRYEQEGIAFHRCYDAASLAAGGLDEETFGLTFVSPAYIKQRWSEHGFSVLAQEQGMIGRFQDWVVLRAK